MKLPDSEISKLNNYLERDYGYFEGLHANWQIVWSDDAIEKRLVTHNVFGIELLRPEVQERYKYKQYIHQKYVLERICPVPQGIETDMIGKFSYEPLFVFMDKDENFLPPRYDVCKIVIVNVMLQSARKMGVEYKDPRTEKDFKEMEIARLDELKDYLFSNETSITDNLAAGSAVGFTKEVN